jgi:hypothetical protein
MYADYMLPLLYHLKNDTYIKDVGFALNLAGTVEFGAKYVTVFVALTSVD